MFNNRLAWVLVPAWMLSAGVAYAQDTAIVTATTGTVVVQKSSGSVRAVAPGSSVQVGDVVITQPNSTARLKFRDGGDLSVAADSQLRIEAYSFDDGAPQKDNALMSLLKGGLRTITGLVGKRGNRDAYKLQTSTATIGIRGTEFIATLCDDECAKEAAKATVAARATNIDIVARVARLTGEAVVIEAAGAVRPLKVGSPVYQGNIVETRTRSHAVLVFADEGRVTLQPESRFAVERFSYAPNSPEQGSSAVRLLKGGIRALTGLIGKRHPQAYQVQTVTATIGIRGTGFDAFCTGTCESGVQPPVDPASKPQPVNANGLFVHTWQDAVIVRNAAGTFTVESGQTVQVLSPDQPPSFLTELPGFMQDAPGPRPDSVEIDFRQLFGVEAAPGGGLYVLVKDGIIVLAQGERLLELERGESAFAGFVSGDLYRLPAPPPALQFFENQLPPLAPPLAPPGGLICSF